MFPAVIALSGAVATIKFAEEAPKGTVTEAGTDVGAANPPGTASSRRR